MLKDTNFIEVLSFLPFLHKNFIFVDSRKCLAEKAFIRNRVPVKIKEIWAKDKTDYQIVFCKVPKSRVQNFQTAMREMLKTMPVLGCQDYEDACNELLNELIEGMRKDT